MRSHIHTVERWYSVLYVRLDALCKLETLRFVIRAKVAYISNKPPIEAGHAFPLIGMCRLVG